MVVLTGVNTRMKINIKPNIEIPTIAPVIEVEESACLRDALLMIVPQVIDRVTGQYKDDPDIWNVLLNDTPVHSLKEGLDTPMKTDDTIKMELIIMAGG